MLPVLLTTKYHLPPAAPDWVPRQRLLLRLDEALLPGRRHIMVSAPAGSGKTTLVRAWIDHIAASRLAAANTPLRTAWLSLDEDDDDLVVLLSYLAAALQAACPDLAPRTFTALMPAGAEPFPPARPILAELINRLAGLPGLTVLVLDDYHWISLLAIHECMAFLLDHLPESVCLVIVSRADALLPVSRLRGRGQLVEIREADLRFDDAEAVQFLNERMGLRLDLADVRLLNEHTEGWATGLQMAALALRALPDAAHQSTGFIRTFSGSHRFVLDYLMDEVFSRLPVQTQSFLLHTAILDRFCAELCVQVLGEPAPAGEDKPVERLLASLQNANLFLIPLDEERRWFRYHHLFAGLLRARLAQTDPELAPVLQKRAAQWFEKNGLLEEAVFYLNAAQDRAGLVRLIEQNIRPMMRAGRIMTVARWARLLPDDLVLNHPWLCLLSGWLLVGRAEFEMGGSYLDRAEELLKQGAPRKETGEMLGIIYSLRTQIIEMNGDIPATIEAARKALELLDPDNIVARSSVDHSLGRAYYASGDMVQADQVWSEFIYRTVHSGAQSIYAIVTSNRSIILGIQGKLQEAIHNCRQAIDYMLANDITRFFGSGNPYLGLGMQTFQINDLVAAENNIDEGMKQNRVWGNLNLITIGLSYKARLRIAQGDLDSAWAFLQEEERIIQGYRLFFEVRSNYLACSVLFYLAKGDIAAAARIVKENGLRSDDPLSFRSEQDHISLSRVLIAQGRYDEAEGLLHRLADAAQAGGRFGRLIEILSLRAAALCSLSRTPEAIQLLETSLTLAEPEGYRRVFIDAGEPMVKLLEMAVQKGIHREYACRLLAEFPGSQRQPASGIDIQQRNLSLIEPLSGREIEVLHLLAAGLANKEIAQRLHISVRTVKYHTTNIFMKLQVEKRAQAIVKAREVGLLKGLSDSA
jgi:LuxR family transcriptional regulator, maltose regulon positive regulatory protein